MVKQIMRTSDVESSASTALEVWHQMKDKLRRFKSRQSPQGDHAAC